MAVAEAPRSVIAEAPRSVIQYACTRRGLIMTERQADLMVFIDVICPWCYIGKRRMEKALAMLQSPARIRVTWLPFELNLDMPKQGMERREYRIRKFGSWERS